MISSAKVGVQKIVAICVAQGMKQVVVSPGSRNAPLIIAFNQHPEIECTVIPDERSAAFVALGMALKSQTPVGILCTSGSAPLNYYPAISEAYYQGIPLVVFTADRPQAWVNQGDGQTIVQDNVFNNHIRYSVTIPEVQNDADSWFLEREMSTAFAKAMDFFKGPVHINLPFSEPLYNQVTLETETNVKVIRRAERYFSLAATERNQMKSIWETSSRILILCGQMNPNPNILKELQTLSERANVSVWVENTSNLVDMRFIHCIDRTLNRIPETEKERFAPDLLITLGGAIVSKRIKSFLRAHPPKAHWKIGFDFPFMDTYQALTTTFEVPETVVLSELNTFPTSKTESTYGFELKQLDFLNQEKSTQFFENEPAFSDLTVFQTVLDYIPEDAHLHLANSSVVRYCQLFDPIKTINYWCNRGTSGIDGSTSTTVGFASASPEQWNALITGDVSFFYDSNAFWNHLKNPNLRIFLINNGGGGIFKIIPGPKSTQELDDFFVFKHQFEAEYICKAFGISYFKAATLEEIENQMESFFEYDENNGAKLLEIFTDATINDGVLDSFFDFLKK